LLHEEDEDDDSDGDGDYNIEDVEGDDDEIDYSDRTLLLQLLMNQQLSAGIPITSRVFDCHRTRHFDASSVSLHGYRDNMEDQHLIHFDLKNHPNCSVFGVFDGHGGDLTSKFVRDHLLALLEGIKSFDDESLIRCMKELDLKWIEFENQRRAQQQEEEDIEALAFVGDDNGDGDSENEQLTEMESGEYDNEQEDDEDEDIDLGGEGEHKEETAISPKGHKALESAESNPMNMSTNEHGCVGSTVVYCIVEYDAQSDNYKITTVNLGDSRAILLQRDIPPPTSSLSADPGSIADDAKEKEGHQKGEYRLVELTKDHKPDDPEEKERIVKAGGEVKFSRVDGDLALSRAIGDTRYKQNDRLPAEEQKISCVPAITHQTCSAGDTLMVFCDGIVECKSNEDILQFIHNAKAKEAAHRAKTKTSKTSKTLQTAKAPTSKPVMTSSLGDADSDSSVEELSGISIVQHLREPELQYLASTESLQLIPRHTVELRGLEKLLLNLTEWALDSGSKDNMTAMMITIGGSGATQPQYERIWSPGEFYRHKKEFNSIGDDIDDKEKMTLDRFMRLFEADCKNTGWNMHDEYENALLQKILYVNDLITNLQQKANLQKLIRSQSAKLSRLEVEESASLTSSRSRKSQKSSPSAMESASPSPKPSGGSPKGKGTPKKKAKKGKRKKMDSPEEAEHGGRGGGDGGFSKGSPRKRRKL